MRTRRLNYGKSYLKEKSLRFLQYYRVFIQQHNLCLKLGINNCFARIEILSY